MSGRRVILAFDIGIRNLAWCLMEDVSGATGPTRRVLGWQNYDLLAGAGHEAPKGKITCSACSVKAAFWNTVAGQDKPTCLRHCPKSHPPLMDLSGVVLKKIPALATLRALVGPTAKKSMSRAAAIMVLQASRSLPLEQVKVKKAVEHEMSILHDAIRTFVAAHATEFRAADQILLENQPVLKNPTMKTVQILLYATLRDLLQPAPPPIKLVHAGKKVTGKEKGDAGYKSRKDASEALCLERLGAQAQWKTFFEAQSKRSDLADAFCMCWDALAAPGRG